MTGPLGGAGRVRMEPGGRAYQNSYAPPGKTIRVALCGKCLDTGRELTDDGSLGAVCDCTYGDALLYEGRKPCPIREPGTGWVCTLQLGHHGPHASNSGGVAHDFYSREQAS